MKQKWLIILICVTILGFIYTQAVFAQQKTGVKLQLTVNPVLYSEIKDGQLLIKSNSYEVIAVYSDSGMIYTSSNASSSLNLQQGAINQYSIISAP
jgi:hypothetical protein